MDLGSAFEFTFDGGLLGELFAGEHDLVNVGEVLGGVGDECEPFAGAVFFGEGDVEDVHCGFGSVQWAGDGGVGFDLCVGGFICNDGGAVGADDDFEEAFEDADVIAEASGGLGIAEEFLSAEGVITVDAEDDGGFAVEVSTDHEAAEEGEAFFGGLDGGEAVAEFVE